MVSNGNHPLNHYDDVTLEEYVLMQLLPEDEEKIRQHLAVCPSCRAKAAEIQAFCQQIKNELLQDLDEATPGSNLDFDRIEWRSRRRRNTLWLQLQQHAPGFSSMLLISLFGMAFLLLILSSDTNSLRSLELTNDYQGPPAIIAAATDDGLVIIRATSRQAQVIEHLAYITNPRNLQFSPDGRWLALQQGNTLHIIETRDAGQYTRITLTELADWAWSPDSQTLAYTDGLGQLGLLEVGTQTYRILVPAEEGAWGAPLWTSDGSQIAYAVTIPLPTTGGPHVRQGIWRVTLETGYRVELARNPTPTDTLLLPAAWANHDLILLAWDINAGIASNLPSLYRVDVAAHEIQQIEGNSLAQGTRLAWPVSSSGVTFMMDQDQLIALDLKDSARWFVPDPIPWPHMLDWAPNGAWAACVVPGVPEGEGLFLLAIHDGTLRPMQLPAGASEKAVFWAGYEHLFVIRQPQDTTISELWLVSLTTGEPPQRILTNARLPETGPHMGWRWQDVLAMQVITR